MSLTSDFSQGSEKGSILKQYQPRFPLVYDSIYGPYAPITDLESSLQRDFLNLMLTSPGEWPMNPDLGVGLRRYLFENYDSSKFTELRPSIIKQVDKYLPNVQVQNVDISSNDTDRDNNRVFITISYTILGNRYMSTKFALDRDLKTTMINLQDVKSTIAENSLNSGLKSSMVKI